MKILSLTAALTVAGWIVAGPVLAQNSTLQPPKYPAFQNPGGVAGGFASSTSKDAASKQNAQSVSPSGNEDTSAGGKQK
jgi:hypothetical protein